MSLKQPHHSEAKVICSQVTLDAQTACSWLILKAKTDFLVAVKKAKTTRGHLVQEAEAACSKAICEVEAWKVSQAAIFHKEHGKYTQDLEKQAIGDESRSCINFLSTCQVVLQNGPPWLKGALATSYHILLGQTPLLPPHVLPQKTSPMEEHPTAAVSPHQHPNLLGLKGNTFAGSCGEHAYGQNHFKGYSGRTPSPKRQETPPWFKRLKPSHAKAFSWDSAMVKEARREFFLKHSYNFITDSACNLSGTFRHLAASADLLGTSIYEIQSSWTGQEKLKQTNYALQSLPKGLKFLWVVSPSEFPKVMGLMGIHDPDALHCFDIVTYCPWCGNEGQNKGTMVNHLQTIHYRLGLVCNRCHGCPSTMSNTLCHHGQHDCCQLRGTIPSELVPSD